MKFNFKDLITHLKESGISGAKLVSKTMVSLDSKNISKLDDIQDSIVTFAKNAGYLKAKRSFSGVVLGTSELIVINTSKGKSGIQVNIFYENLKNPSESSTSFSKLSLSVFAGVIGDSEQGNKEVKIYYNDLSDKKKAEIRKLGLDVNEMFPLVLTSSKSSHGNIFNEDSENNNFEDTQKEVSNNPQIELKYLGDFTNLLHDRDCQKYTHLEMKDKIKDLTTEQLQAYLKLTDKAMEIENVIYKLNRASKEILENRLLLGSKWSVEDGIPLANSEQNYKKKAEEIIKQMGGINKLSAMTGANTFIALEDGLSFKFKGCKQCNYVKITVNGKDLYDLDFKNIKGMNVKDFKTEKDVGVENLKKTFTKTTGLDLSLGRHSEHKVDVVEGVKEYLNNLDGKKREEIRIAVMNRQRTNYDGSWQADYFYGKYKKKAEKEARMLMQHFLLMYEKGLKPTEEQVMEALVGKKDWSKYFKSSHTESSTTEFKS